MSGASARTTRRRRQRYKAQGVEGLIDGRRSGDELRALRRTPRVLEVLMIVADDTRYRQASSAEACRLATTAMLETTHGPGSVQLPSRSTFRWLVRTLEQLVIYPYSGHGALFQHSQNLLP